MSGTSLPIPLSASLSGQDPALGPVEGECRSGDGVFEQRQGEVHLVCKHGWEQEGQRLERSVDIKGNIWGLVFQPNAAAGWLVCPLSLQDFLQT